MAKKLTGKRAAFVREYLKDLNATAAARRAGYSEHTAKTQGSRLLTFGDVQAAIGQAQRKVAERDDVTIDRIVQEYAAIAFASMGDFLSFTAKGVELKSSETLTPKQLKAVLEVRQHTLRDGTTSVSFKLHSKGDALEALGRHLGMFGDSLKVQKAVEEMLENVRDRMPEEAYGHFVNAIGAAMGFPVVAARPAAAPEAGADAGGSDPVRH